MKEFFLGVSATRYSFVQFGTVRMEEDQLLPDSARLQLTSLRDADYALHEIPGKQRHFISSLNDCFGNFFFALNCVSSFEWPFRIFC